MYNGFCYTWGTQKHLVLTGLRGVGKTVLLNEFEFDCESAGWAGEVRELAEESRISHVVAKAARKALLQMSATKRAGDAVRRALRVLKGFTVSLVTSSCSSTLTRWMESPTPETSPTT